MAKILTPLLRKLPSLSSTRLTLSCKCESIIASYTTENGRCLEKEHKPERILNAEKVCNDNKGCRCVLVNNMIATSSSVANNREPVLQDKGSEAAPGTASEAKDKPQCQCSQCQEMRSMPSAPKGTKLNIPPEVPTTCCMTGCPNCVWLKFAEDMMKFSIESGANARKIIEEIDDQNLKTFLLLELDNMQKV